MEFKCKVENSNLNKIKTGNDILITLTSSAFCLFDESNNQKYGFYYFLTYLEYSYKNDYPSFKCIRRTNNKGELFLT